MDLKSSLKEMKSDGDAMRMARSLVSDSVYVVDGVEEGNEIEITSSDVDYMAEEEPSTEKEAFDDSTDDGDHEDHFGFELEDNNP
ncbi:hypothetical protein Ahy_A03g013773 isoform B [Arachis hypogaea]|uniref:Uncharacterized protein n=1 Tax=Arachis hypogaea TaxID=3818 RepID=A0A445DW69_ARAHY|nr:hypothetical protein Ahy_A03g013773 isoform B [Arachis hypogaea]